MINSFGFIGHPIDLEHLYKILSPFSAIARKIPPYYLNEFLTKIPPYRLNSVRGIRSLKGAMIDCHTIICPLMPASMVGLDEGFVLNRITQSVRKVEKLGGKIATLGGFTSVIGNEGSEVAKRVNIAVTSGNSYTAGLAIEGVVRAAYYMDLDLSSATLAVIGATGDIGSICTKVLSRKVKNVNLVARQESKLIKLAEEIKKSGSSNVAIYKQAREAIVRADVILTVTSAISAVINPGDLKPGAIVCDVAIPANIAKEIANKRDDIFVFEGGLARLPYQHEIKDRMFAELMPTGSIYGCLAEGVVLTFEGKFENYSIGRGNITEEKVDEIMRIAKKHGLRLADFFCGDKFYSDDDIESIKRNAKRNILSGNLIKR